MESPEAVVSAFRPRKHKNLIRTVLVLVEVVVVVLVEVVVDVIVGPEVIRQEHAEEMTLAAVTVADAPKAPLYLYTVAVVARLLNGS
jgi:hypothetical protein